MKVVIELLDEDGTPVGPEDFDFEIEQLRWAEKDREHGYVHLDTTNYVFPVRIVGVVTAEDSPGDQTVMAVIPLDPQ